jgi:hypothetical protein
MMSAVLAKKISQVSTEAKASEIITALTTQSAAMNIPMALSSSSPAS